jgi:dTDP-4-amino-4,6-dideoxygalactose transaminase
MDLDQADDAIGPETGAVIATSLFGYPVDLDQLSRLRERHPRVAVIQDCAHSFLATWKGASVATAGDAAVFGLNLSKMITSIFGGMVTTDRDDLAQALRQVRDTWVERPGVWKSLARRAYLLAARAAFLTPLYGTTSFLERRGLLRRFVRYYDETVIDMPADYLRGLTGVEARVGRMQIGRYESLIAHRRAAAAYYQQRLAGIADLTLPPFIDGATYSHYVPRTSRRTHLLQCVLDRGAQLGSLIDYCIPDMPSYRQRPGARYRCPVARRLAETAVNLPVTTAPSSWERVAQVVTEALRNSSARQAA